jgi:hypothetical protein
VATRSRSEGRRFDGRSRGWLWFADRQFRTLTNARLAGDTLVFIDRRRRRSRPNRGTQAEC